MWHPRLEEVPRHRLETSDGLVLETVNSVRRTLNLRQLAALHELFDVDDDFLCTFPELDHYSERLGAQYYGAVFTQDEGTHPSWPEQGRKRVYVYMRPEMRAFHPLAEALSKAGHSALSFAPGIDDDTMRRYRSAGLKFVREPVRLSQVAAQADAAVLYGGHGTVSAMLLAGVPLALYPTHVEQALLTRKVAQIGAGAIAEPQAKVSEIRHALNAVLDDDRHKDRATAFAAKYARFDPGHVVSRIAARIVTHCGN